MAVKATFYSTFDIDVGVRAFVLGIVAEWVSKESLGLLVLVLFELQS